MSYTLGKVIEVEQVLQELSTADIAKRSDLSEDYIRKLMRNEIKSPSLPTYYAISKAINIPFLELLVRTGQISLFDSHILSDEEAIHFIDINSEYLKKINIDSSKLTVTDKKFIANYLMEELKKLSSNYKY